MKCDVDIRKELYAWPNTSICTGLVNLMQILHVVPRGHAELPKKFMTSTTGSSGQEVLQACTGEFRVYRVTRRGPSTPDSMSQTYLPVVGRKIKPQSAGPYAADVNASSFKKTGRAAHRIRRKHRLQLRPLRNCMMDTVNTQGLNWMRIAHQDKLETLLDLRRRYNWDVNRPHRNPQH